MLAVGGFLFLHTIPTHAAGTMLAYWKFDESSAGDDAVDESGNGNDLTPFNDPQPSTDRPSELGVNFANPYSRSLDGGVGQYFEIEDTPSLDATASGVTIAVWVKFAGVSNNYESIVSKWDIGARQQWTLQLNANNKIGWWTGDGEDDADNLESTSTMDSDTWYHIIVTSEGLEKKLYINGVLEGSKTSSVAMGVAEGVGIGVGAKTEGSPEYLNGFVDDLRIYSYALSDSEASDLADGEDVQPTPSLTGGSPLVYEQGAQGLITDLQVQGGTTNPNVSVKLFVNNGRISMSTITGLTFYNADGSVRVGQPSNSPELQFSGSMSNVNTALASLRYVRTSGTGTDTLSASLVQPGEVFFSGNDHLYEYYAGPVTWSQARTNAEGLTKYGAQGYLATITSQAENDFIKDRLKSDSWIGASDSAVEGVWRWVTGPESGQQFWSGAGGGNTVNDMYAHWNNPKTGGTGAEPNQSGDEDCAQFYYSNNGLWNDLSCGNSLGYIVEFGAPSSLPTVSSKDISITTTADATPPTQPGKPSATSPTTDTTPTVSWTASTDSASGLANPAYTLEWSSSATFVSTSGSATTNGTSLAPSSGLADGTWYFRVRATDAASNASISAISDAVVIDSTGPSTPGTPSTNALWMKDNTPTFEWTESVDVGVGLAFIAYAVEWSQNTSFIGLGGTAGITSNSYTIPDNLSMADGTWYFRVKAIDALGNESNWAPYATVNIDTEPPVITRSGASTVAVVLGEGYTDEGATASDDGEGDISSDIVTSNPVDSSEVGSYTVTYDVTDSAGNVATTVTRTVHVVSDADLNNDGTADAIQENVVGVTSPKTNNEVAIHVDNTCSLSNVSIKNQTELAPDGRYDYPVGLLDFTANCGTNGFTTIVTQYYYDPPSGNFVLRKFMNGVFETINDASISRQIINGKQVLVVSYAVTDGGPLDADGVEDGVIVDPAGPALSVPGAPNAGYQRQASDVWLIGIISLVIVVGYRMRRFVAKG